MVGTQLAMASSYAMRCLVEHFLHVSLLFVSNNNNVTAPKALGTRPDLRLALSVANVKVHRERRAVGGQKRGWCECKFLTSSAP